MDGISAAASVAGVLTVTVQAILIAKQFINGVRKSNQTISTFIEELEVLLSSLSSLKEMLDKQNLGTNQFTQTSLLLSKMTICETQLSDLTERLNQAASSRLQKLIWPLSEKEHRQSMQDLRAFSQWIQLSLSMDSTVLLTKSSQEVVKILSAQIESLKELETIGNRVTSIQASLEAQETLLAESHRQQENQKLFSWLSTYDERAKHFVIKEPRVEGTGQWFLESSEFQQWMKSDLHDNILWYHGNLGAGKSVLTSLAIDHIKNKIELDTEVESIAYLYFEQHDREFFSPSVVCSSLAKQLLVSQKSIPENIRRILDGAKDKPCPDLPIAKAILLNALSIYQKNYVIIDALDECDENKFRKSVLEILRVIGSRTDVRLLITSRSHCHDIERQFSGKLLLEVSANEQDLKQYLNSRFEEASIIETTDKELQAAMVDKIVDKAKHMFLLAALQIQVVIDAPTIGEMEESCENLPSTLDEAFDDTIRRIKALSTAKEQLAMKTLAWIACTKSGSYLRMTDLQQALAIRLGQECTDSRFRPSSEVIINCCRGLVVQDKGTERVRFSHIAIQDYLQRHPEAMFPEPHKMITKTCLELLKTEADLASSFDSEGEIQSIISGTPLLWYAASTWGYHFSKASSEELTNDAMQLLCMQTRKNGMCQIFQYLLGRKYIYWNNKEADSHSMLHIAALFGLEGVANRLFQQGDPAVDATTTLGTTALMKASSRGHTAIMRLLLSKGADPNIANWYGNSLHSAAEAGQVESIEVLLQYKNTNQIGKNWIEQKNCHGFSALECAHLQGHQAAVELLICKNLNPSSYYDRCIRHDLYNSYKTINRESKTAKQFERALVMAIVKDKLHLARVLISYGAQPDRVKRSDIRPLAWAAWLGKIDAVRLLLDAGADVNGTSNYFARATQGVQEHTAYWFATARNHVEVQQLLINFGALVSPEPDPKEVALVEDKLQRYEWSWRYRMLLPGTS